MPGKSDTKTGFPSNVVPIWAGAASPGLHAAGVSAEIAVAANSSNPLSATLVSFMTPNVRVERAVHSAAGAPQAR